MKLCFSNSAAPSLVRSNLQQFSYDLCGAIVNEENGDNLGVTLCPAQALTRGQGHVQEASFTKRLAGSNLNIDRVWSLTFDGHEDPIDERPLMFLGRIMLPMATRVKDSGWKSSHLLTKAPWVQAGTWQRSADMQMIEELGEEALPTTADTTVHPSQAEKLQQIGYKSCLAVLETVLGGMERVAKKTSAATEPKRRNDESSESPKVRVHRVSRKDECIASPKRRAHRASRESASSHPKRQTQRVAKQTSAASHPKRQTHRVAETTSATSQPKRRTQRVANKTSAASQPERRMQRVAKHTSASSQPK